MKQCLTKAQNVSAFLIVLSSSDNCNKSRVDRAFMIVMIIFTIQTVRRIDINVLNFVCM